MKITTKVSEEILVRTSTYLCLFEALSFPPVSFALGAACFELTMQISYQMDKMQDLLDQLLVYECECPCALWSS